MALVFATPMPTQIVTSLGSEGTKGALEPFQISTMLLFRMPLKVFPELESSLAWDAVISLTFLEVFRPATIICSIRTNQNE